jgi:hypothetical protein
MNILIQNARAADGETAIINGKIVMKNKKPTTLNVEKVNEMAEKTKSLLERPTRNVK